MDFRFQQTVPAAWVDYNGHMNDAEYNRAFSQATDAFINHIGLHPEARNEFNYTIFTLETHTCYVQEMKEGEAFEIISQVLDYDKKRIHLFLAMYNADGELVATLEEMLMGIDVNERRGAPFPNPIEECIADMFKKQEGLEKPKQAGRVIGIRRK